MASPPPFSSPCILFIMRGFFDPDKMPLRLTRGWYITPWCWTNHDDAKSKILDFFEISEDGWKIKPETTISWAHGVCYAGYDTDDIPFSFGDDVTIAIVDLEMIW